MLKLMAIAMSIAFVACSSKPPEPASVEVVTPTAPEPPPIPPHPTTEDGVLQAFTQATEQQDIEAVIADEEEAALKWRRASTALDDLRRADPEAAEVIRRRRGLDGLGEEEALESIAATGLTCTGRSIGRESVRQIQKRGEAVLRRRAIEPRAS